MGCFSFLCKVCERPINSDSHSGQHCTLYLLEDGKVIEEMTGQYDSYGRVFDENKESVNWKSYPWSMKSEPDCLSYDKTVCDLMFTGYPFPGDPDPTEQELGNGIAAVHTRCKRKKAPAPTTRSDPIINPLCLDIFCGHETR